MWIQNFDEFITGQDWNKYNPPMDYEHTFENFMKANGVDDDTVTEDMMDWYSLQICHLDSCNDPRQNYGDSLRLNSHVDEMLNRTSVGFLKKQLNMELGADDENHVSNTSDNENVNVLWVSKDIYDAEKIMKTCDKCMWTFSAVQTLNKMGNVVWSNPMDSEPYVDETGGFPIIKIKVDAVKTRNITDFIKNECGGRIYHICPRGVLDRVLKSGLRMKGEKNAYRYIKNKVYFFCGETKEDIVNNLAEVAITKYAWDTDTGWITDDYVLLEIDVNGYNISFYQDGYYGDNIKYIGYTYNYFPPKRIREVDVYEFKPDYEDPDW